jgi:D-inositol-3-phosphate glycosyltransferase
MTTKLDVALVSEHASPLAALGGADAGGQNVHVAALARALAARGCRVTVHTRRDDRDLPSRVRVARGVVVDHVDAGPPHPIPKDDLLPHMDAFGAELVARWARRRPDVAHAHFWMSGLATLAAARPLGVPVVQTFHALGVVKRRHQGDADTSPPRREAIESALARDVDLVIATCGDERRELVGLGGDPALIEVVPCGIDPARFSPDGPAEPRPGGARGGRTRFVTVGRLVRRKGVDDVIRALARVPDGELIVVGGPAADRLASDPEARRLRAVAAEAGVADRVELRGRLPHDAVARLLRSADVAVAAPWYEPFGIVPVEAMACGLPLVGTAVGGLLDTVVPGRTGLLVPPRSPERLGLAMAALAADPARRARLGRAAAMRTRALYDWDTVAARTLAAYEALLAERAGAVPGAGGTVDAAGTAAGTTAVSA